MNNVDSLGNIEELRSSLDDSELVVASQIDAQVAWRVLKHLGYCRLYGLKLPTDLTARLTKTLLRALFVPATVELIRVVEFAILYAKKLPSKFDTALPDEDLNVCSSMLHILMHIWSVSIALEDIYRFYLAETNNFGSEMSRQYDRVLDTIGSLDAILQDEEYIRLLSVVVELPLLENWRQSLAGTFRENLPWWLDGRLEQTAAMLEHEIAAF